MLDVNFQAESINGGQEIVIELEANGFLYNMARNIVGTLVWIGRGKRAPDCIPELIAAGDRRLAGATAPAKGLTLLQVWYDNLPAEIDTLSLAAANSNSSAANVGDTAARQTDSES